MFACRHFSTYIKCVFMSGVCTLTIASFRFCQIQTLENFQVHVQIGVACVGFEVGCSTTPYSQWTFYLNLTQDPKIQS